MIAVFVIAALCIGVDQLTKYLAAGALYPDGSVDVIKGVFRFTYVENRGAAFGSLTDHRWVFLVFSTVLIVALTVYTVKKRPASLLERISIGMLIGGGVGNMIDRIALGYVIDFLDFCAFPNLWKWVFNGADAFVCIGTVLIMIYIIKSEPKDGNTAGGDGNGECGKGGTEDGMAE